MAGYIKTDGQNYSKAAPLDVPQPWEPNIPTPEPPAPELPAIAAGDAGKVLAVNDDCDGVEWTSGGGGGGVLIATDTSGTLDITGSTLAVAMENGLAAIKVYGVVKPIVAYEYDDIEYAHKFTIINYIGESTVGYSLYSGGDDSYPMLVN